MNSKSEWQLIRSVLNSAIDACETMARYDVQNMDSNQLSAPLPNQNGVTVFDLLESSWRKAEIARLDIIRARQELGDNLPIIPQMSRLLTFTANACAEAILTANPNNRAIGQKTSHYPNGRSINEILKDMETFYTDHLIPLLTLAIDKTEM